MNLEMESNRRILLIDDNPMIHEDFRKILRPAEVASSLEATARLLLGDAPDWGRRVGFDIASAASGQEGLVLIERAVTEGKPFMMAFVDMRMPNGWDGLETVEQLWKVSPELQVVICTAYADHSWDEIVARLGQTDSMVILKKPFDNVEVLQLAHALTKKWIVTRESESQRANLDRLVGERTVELRETNAKLKLEIQERARAQEALQRSEERFVKAFQAAPIALAIQTWDNQTHVDVNVAFLDLVGRSRDAVVGQTAAELDLWSEPGRWKELLECVAGQRRVRNAPCGMRRYGGSSRATLISVESITLDAEPCLLLMAQDVTEQRSLEDQLRQAQKMEAIGQLAAGVAHDFNNVLTVIQGHAGLEREEPDLPDHTRASLEQIGEAADRGARITKQLLTFSRKRVTEMKPLRLECAVKDLLGMLQSLAGAKVELALESEADLPVVRVDEGSLGQVLMNLVSNARDAMPEGGRIMVGISAVTMDESMIEAGSGARPGDFVKLTVADSGCGIDPTVLRRVFEPFFTTKGVGKGTGLGLSMVYAIARQHRGWIEVKSEVGRGTEFGIFLPCDDPTSRGSGQTTRLVRRPRRSQGRESILLVEEDPAVRSVTATTLQQQGYHVQLATGGTEMRGFLQKLEADPDLLILELSTLNRDSSLAMDVRRQRPQLKVLYTTGGSPRDVDLPVPMVEGVNLLQKPFEAGRLVAVVRRCLDTVVVEDPVASPSTGAVAKT